MVDDEWVKIARVEDAVVAELLLRLKGVNMITPPPMASTSKPKQAVLIEWRVRQRRSKAVTVQQPKDQAPRDSPSTPLSFSGGATTSVSFGRGGSGASGSGGRGGGGGGLEDCGPEEESTEISAAESAPKTSEMTRSKVVRSSESNTIRKSKKKKLQTLAELKAEDEFLARERMHLQKELKSVRDNLEKERARNDNFKRIKLQQMEYVHSAPVTFQPIVAGDTIILQHSSSAAIVCSEPKIEEPVSGFVLPDLNLPLEENFNSLC